jgi:hypothetical protein
MERRHAHGDDGKARRRSSSVLLEVERCDHTRRGVVRLQLRSSYGVGTSTRTCDSTRRAGEKGKERKGVGVHGAFDLDVEVEPMYVDLADMLA